MQHKNITIIGTSHIAKQSLDDVRKVFETSPPDIIALELDAKRLYALKNKKNKDKIRFRDIKKVGIKGFLFLIFGAWVERKLGDYVGVAPGSEMLLANNLAKKHNKQVVLIDQDIEMTLRRLSEEITWKEKWRFFIDIIKAMVLRKKEIDFDLTKVPSKEIIQKLVKKVKTRYPNVYKVLIKERNIVIAKNLYQLHKENPDKKIVAFIGAGHEEDVVDLIKKISEHKIEMPRLNYSFQIIN